MPRTLNGTDQYLHRPTFNTTGTYSIAGWFKATRLTHFEPLSALGGSAGDAGATYWRLDLRGDQAGDLIWFTHSGGSEAKSGSAFPTGVWAHVAAISTSSVMVYLNGVAGSQTAGTSGQAVVSGATLSLGTWFNTSASRAGYFAGDLSDFAYWSVALTAAEVASLAAGALPRMIRPESLQEYVPLANPDAPGNGIRGFGFTDVSTTLGTGSPRIYR